MGGWIDPSVFVIYRIVHGNGWVLAIFIISSWDVNTLRLTRGLIVEGDDTIHFGGTDIPTRERACLRHMHVMYFTILARNHGSALNFKK